MACSTLLPTHVLPPVKPQRPSTDSWSWHLDRRGVLQAHEVCQHDNVQEPSRLKRMQCAQNGCHRRTGTGPWQGVRPFSAAAQRTGSLPDAGDRYTAQSCTKSNSSSQRALPALWLECRFCLSSPSTNSNPAGTPLNSALVRPSMAEPMQESSTDGRRNAASRKHVQSIVQLSTCCKNKITTRRGRDDAIQKSFRHL
jgi:hypothetical protein